MRIGFNAHLLPRGNSYRSAGVASYVSQLMKRLPVVAPQHDYVFFVPSGISCSQCHASRLPTWNPLVRILWEQAVEPIEASKQGLAVVHSPVNVTPFALRQRSIVTLHDLAFVKYPGTFRSAKALYLRALVKASVMRATRVITPSHATSRDATDILGVSGEKIEVIPLAVDEHFRRAPDLKSPLDSPFILHVGTLEPRKNLPCLLRAFARLSRLGYPHKLALVGPPGWLYDEVYKLITQLDIESCVVVKGFVEDLLPWYNCADLFVFPSMYEGFGLPPLEAMACGTPVVTSSSGSLQEVVDDAALVVLADDEDGYLNAIRRVLDDPELASRLSSAGLARAAMFSWDETARRTARVYEQVGVE